MPLTATGSDIETMVITDFLALLTAGGLTAVAGQQVETDAAVVFPRVVVDTEGVSDAVQGGGGEPTGIYKVELACTCETQAGDATEGDDATGAAMKTLMGEVREVLHQDDLVAQLNALANAYYYGCVGAGADRSNDGRIRLGQIRFSVHCQPGIPS